MKRRINSALAGIIAVFALVVLAGCERSSDAPPPPPVKYSLKLYGDDVEPLRTFTGINGTAGEGIAYITVEGDSDYTKVVGTWVLEPEGSTADGERAADSKYKVTLYSGTKVLRIWYVPYATAGEGMGYLKTNESADYTKVAGSFTIEPLK